MIKDLIREKIGILRSVAIYYWKPFNKRRLMNFYSQFISKGDLCFDVGAHLGNRTNAWYHLGAKVIAIEPQPQCIAFLEKKFGNKEEIIIEKKAIGSERGKATLHIAPMYPTISTLSTEKWRDIIDEDSTFKVHWDKQKEVEVVRLEDLVQKYGVPAFCKLDIEDFEVEALKGLKTPLPCLSIEFYPATPEKAIECIHLLENLGKYEYNWSFGESQVLNETKWMDAKDLIHIFENYTRDDSYGDFYARLKK